MSDTRSIGEKLGEDIRPSEIVVYSGKVIDNVQPLKAGWRKEKGVWVKENSIERTIMNGKTLLDLRVSHSDEKVRDYLNNNYFYVLVGYVQNPEVKGEFMLINDDNSLFKDKIMSLTSETKLNESGRLPLSIDEFYEIKSKGSTLDIPRLIVEKFKDGSDKVSLYKMVALEFMAKGDQAVVNKYIDSIPGNQKDILEKNFRFYFTENNGLGLVGVGSVGDNSYINCNSNLNNDIGLLPGVNAGGVKK